MVDGSSGSSVVAVVSLRAAATYAHICTRVRPRSLALAAYFSLSLADYTIIKFSRALSRAHRLRPHTHTHTHTCTPTPVAHTFNATNREHDTRYDPLHTHTRHTCARVVAHSHSLYSRYRGAPATGGNHRDIKRAASRPNTRSSSRWPTLSTTGPVVLVVDSSRL